jgi:membrane-associated phospholipid phosphatase
LVIGTLLFFGFADSERGLSVGLAFNIIYAIAIVVYIFFPVSTEPYRLQILAQPSNGYWWQYATYQLFNPASSGYDTPFNCFPSMHAGMSTICFYTWYRYAKAKPSRWTKIMAGLSLVFAIGIILSTLFLKQHYIADLIAGIVLAWVVGRLVFDRLWKKIDVPRAEIN